MIGVEFICENFPGQSNPMFLPGCCESGVSNRKSLPIQIHVLGLNRKLDIRELVGFVCSWEGPLVWIANRYD